MNNRERERARGGGGERLTSRLLDDHNEEEKMNGLYEPQGSNVGRVMA